MKKIKTITIIINEKESFSEYKGLLDSINKNVKSLDYVNLIHTKKDDLVIMKLIHEYPSVDFLTIDANASSGLDEIFNFLIEYFQDDKLSLKMLTPFFIKKNENTIILDSDFVFYKKIKLDSILKSFSFKKKKFFEEVLINTLDNKKKKTKIMAINFNYIDNETKTKLEKYIINLIMNKGDDKIMNLDGFLYNLDNELKKEIKYVRPNISC